MTVRTTAGRLSAFAHLAGFRTKPKAEETPADTDETTTTDEVEEKVDETSDRVDELEERVDELEEAQPDPDPDAEPEDPAAKKAWQAGQRAGAKAERARGAAIFGAEEAATNGPLAASLAFESDVPVAQALALLKAGASGVAPTARRGNLDQRMSGQRQPRVGAGAGPAPAPEGSAQAHIDRMTAAARAVGVAPALKR